MTPVRTPDPVRGKADAVCVAAVGPAREAAIVEAGAAQVGEYLGYSVEGERLVTHYFASTHPGYRGWRWAVTVTRASRAKTVTINEVVMLPGDDAIVAPEWVPWSDRVQPGDLRPGDLFPTDPDDPRLEPGFTDTGAPDDVLAVVEELGLGRERVLSPYGRQEAAERWYGGDFGPESPIAQAVPYKCNSCGYWIRLADSLGQAFGVCANEMAPGDGRVVAYDYGCGAHSDAVIDQPDHPVAEHAFDTTGYDAMELAHAVQVADVPADTVEAELDATDAVDPEIDVTAPAAEELAGLHEWPVADGDTPDADTDAELEAAAEPDSDDADAVQAELEAAAEPDSDEDLGID